MSGSADLIPGSSTKRVSPPCQGSGVSHDGQAWLVSSAGDPHEGQRRDGVTEGF
jgi:hypothetical protein